MSAYSPVRASLHEAAARKCFANFFIFFVLFFFFKYTSDIELSGESREYQSGTIGSIGGRARENPSLISIAVIRIKMSFYVTSDFTPLFRTPPDVGTMTKLPVDRLCILISFR